MSKQGKSHSPTSTDAKLGRCTRRPGGEPSERSRPRARAESDRCIGDRDAPPTQAPPTLRCTGRGLHSRCQCGERGYAIRRSRGGLASARSGRRVPTHRVRSLGSGCEDLLAVPLDTPARRPTTPTSRTSQSRGSTNSMAKDQSRVTSAVCRFLLRVGVLRWPPEAFAGPSSNLRARRIRRACRSSLRYPASVRTGQDPCDVPPGGLSPPRVGRATVLLRIRNYGLQM
jgi:hypothetical protein